MFRNMSSLGFKTEPADLKYILNLNILLILIYQNDIFFFERAAN
jgi:hypothetical protein